MAEKIMGPSSFIKANFGEYYTTKKYYEEI